MTAIVGFHLLLSCAASNIPFRPPAIPLLTTDPFMQTWMRGNTATSAQVTHWDGAEKQMVGLIRVDGKPYQFLGSCTPGQVDKPGPVKKLPGHDVSPGSCDITNKVTGSEDECNELCYNSPKCSAYVWRTSAPHICYLKSCAEPVIASSLSNSGIITGQHPNCTNNIEAATQISLAVHPTRTTFAMAVASGRVALNLTFLSTMFTDDFVRLSRPVYYISVDVASMDGDAHEIELYFDVSAQHAVNSCADQSVEWKRWPEQHGGLSGIQLGNSVQNVVGSKGDRVNIDWGYLHLATLTRNANEAAQRLWAGSAANARTTFTTTGRLPSAADTRQPRKCGDDMPVLATQASLGRAATVSHTVMLAYDDVQSVNYFGEKMSGLWTQTYKTIHEALGTAFGEHAAMLAKSVSHDAALESKLASKFGDKYATLCALSYRQTLAATKLVWNQNQSVAWNFLKEISTNGDMSTMDVIYPASPMLLFTNPELLKLLLIPVLAYAHNDTYIQFTDPYSPHQLGTYPIADSTTRRQEPMPLENSGNMLFMLLAIIRAQTQAQTGNMTWVMPYLPMLRSWADELVKTTEFPANQICTDDFTGKLANNTNLGAKGIIAIETFAELCRLAKAFDDAWDTNCSHYSAVASDYAQTWQHYAYTTKGAPHYKMSFNDLKGIPDSWSIKYNLLWQKLNGLDGPFPWDKIVQTEIKYYKSKSNTFGIPMDPRHTYVKTDWLSWIAAMASTDADFHFIFDPIFSEVTTTSDRNPFTDLYDTKTARQTMGAFIARPVIGGLFAKALLDA